MLIRKIKLYLLSFFNDKSNPLINNVFYIVIGLSLFLLTLSSLYYLILLIPFIIFLIKKKNKILLILFIVVVVITFVYYLLLEYKFNNIDNNITEISGEVIEIKTDDDYTRYKIRYKLNYVYIYCDESNIKVGDVIKCSGEINEIDEVSIKNGFDYKSYLKHNKIMYSFYASEINVLKHNFTIYIIKEKLFNYIDMFFKDSESNILIKGLLFGDTTSFSDELKTSLKTNGIVHLFAVSGLHISLLIMLITKCLNMFKIKENIIEKIICIFLLFYLVVTSFTPSILRCALIYVLTLINKNKLNKMFSSLDICSLSFIFLILINPYIAYNSGFILSYLASFSIILLSNLISKANKYMQILYISIITNLVTLPVIINFNNEINLLSPILNIIYITLTSSIIIPLSIICMLLPYLSVVYKYIAKLYLSLIDVTSNFKLMLKLPHFYPITIIIYILIITLFIIYFKNKKYRYTIFAIFILFISFLSIKNNFNLDTSIYFMYLNDGECTVIRNKSHTVLIDTGDGNNDEVYKYLLNEGIYNIDAIFITHNHNDHYGGLEKINSELKVNTIFINEYNDFSYRDYENIKIIYTDDIITINEMTFYILAPSEGYSDINSNSMVILLNLKNHNILFTADMTISNESEVIENIKKYNFDIEFLKVAHHGSNTSTSISFLNEINAKYAILMVPKKWVGTLPNKEVLSNLYKYTNTVYSTLDYYSFEFKFKNNRILFYPLKV